MSRRICSRHTSEAPNFTGRSVGLASNHPILACYSCTRPNEPDLGRGFGSANADTPPFLRPENESKHPSAIQEESCQESFSLIRSVILLTG
jgi:hypothetical protein